MHEATLPRGTAAARVSAARRSWARFLRRRTAVAGAAITLVFLGAMLLGPWIAPYPPTATNYNQTLAPPSVAHPAGTDDFGRDILSRLIAGSRYSLGMGLAAVTLGAAIGTAWGISSAFYGGVFDNVSMRIVDILLAFPGLSRALARCDPRPGPRQRRDRGRSVQRSDVCPPHEEPGAGGDGAGLHRSRPCGRRSERAHHGPPPAAGRPPDGPGLLHAAHRDRDPHRLVAELSGPRRAAPDAGVGGDAGRGAPVPERGAATGDRAGDRDLARRAGVQPAGGRHPRRARPAPPGVRRLDVPRRRAAYRISCGLSGSGTLPFTARHRIRSRIPGGTSSAAPRGRRSDSAAPGAVGGLRADSGWRGTSAVYSYGLASSPSAPRSGCAARSYWLSGGIPRISSIVRSRDTVL